MWPALRALSEIAGQALGHFRRGVKFGASPGSTNPREARAGGTLIGILTADHDARQARRGDEICAGRAARAGMSARFERDV